MEAMELKNRLQHTYNGKKVFITGHTGFKGSWMVRVLQLLGADVKGYALAPAYHNSLFDLLDYPSCMHSVIGDISDRNTLIQEIISFQPDFIFHLAAQPLVRESYNTPADTFHVNAIGTAHVLDAVRLLEKKCTVVCITTDKVYENKEWIHPYRETDELGGYDPYSASKAAAEIVIQSYRRSFFNPNAYTSHQKSISVARAGNVIGGGDWSTDRLIPDIIKALFQQQAVIIRNPISVRPWQHVLEPIIGYLQLAQKQDEDPIKFATAYNFGPHTEDTLPVEQFVQLVLKTWGSGRYEVQINPNAPHEAGLLRLDITKAQLELYWNPRWNAEMSIAKTVEWYKQHTGDIRAVTDVQINSYLS
jgi:CDP-glucose 4,6-dehydratase